MKMLHAYQSNIVFALEYIRSEAIDLAIDQECEFRLFKWPERFRSQIIKGSN